jgi:hypothetical protein
MFPIIILHPIKMEFEMPLFFFNFQAGSSQWGPEQTLVTPQGVNPQISPT